MKFKKKTGFTVQNTLKSLIYYGRSVHLSFAKLNVSSFAIRILYLSPMKGNLVRRLLHIMLFDNTKVVIIQNEDNIYKPLWLQEFLNPKLHLTVQHSEILI